MPGSTGRIVALGLAAAVGVAAPARADGVRERVSVGPGGAQANESSFEPSISANGRYVAFTTWADDLFADRNGHVLDVVVKDMATGEVTPVSRRPGGGQSNKNSLVPVIAGNGRYVAYQTYGVFSRLDDDRSEDVYVHELATGSNRLASVARGGQNNPQPVLIGGISHDGRHVTFGHDNSAWVRDMRERGCQRRLRPRRRRLPARPEKRPIPAGDPRPTG